MNEFWGMDYGAAMIQVATAGPDQQPAGISFDDGRLEYPVALEIQGKSPCAVGWEAYRGRLEVGRRVRVGFRDAAIDVDGRLNFAGVSIDNVAAQTEVFADLLRRCSAQLGHPQVIVIAVPEHWTHSRWSAPVALSAAGWMNYVLVRHWAAALSAWGKADRHAVVLSLGAGPARAVYCCNDAGRWRSDMHRVVGEISGGRLRDRVLSHISEESVAKFRRRAEDDVYRYPYLVAAVEQALEGLANNEVARIRGELHGGELQFNLSRNDLAQWCEDFHAPMKSAIQEVIGTGDNCPILAVGRVAQLLPWSAWLGREVNVASPDLVARGAARLAGFVRGAFSADDYSVIRLDDGAYLSSRKSLDDAVPFACILERYPESVFPTPRRHAKLVMLDGSSGSQTRLIEGDRFRLGRDPRSEWVFATDKYPGVSRAHAAIVRVGGKYVLNNLTSTGVTLLDGRSVEASPLKSGQRIRLGENGPELRFELS